MTKNDIINIISKETNISKKTVKIIIESISKNIKKYLLLGENIYLRNFCTFLIKKRKEKKARDIKKKKTIKIPAHNVPFLKFSKSFIIKVKKKLPIKNKK